MELSPLPTSLCCLVNLQTLCLNCSWLRDMDFIVNMKDLEILVLSCGLIGQLSIEIEVFPPNIISRLTQLEELYMSYKFDNWHVEGVDNETKNASLDELKHLLELTTLQICIPDAKIVPKSFFSQKLQRHLSQLQEIEVADCENMEEIFTIDRENEVIILDQLHSLSLGKLPKLRSFCYEEEVASTSNQERQILETPMPLFDRKTLKLYKINLKYVFSSSTLGSFEQLQHLDIWNCKVLESIIRIDDLEYNVELSSLKKLEIQTCSEVKAFIFNDKYTAGFIS
ncbi:hypothetical protein ACOSQ4_021600 [Xanthoceras sorbifolium]